MTFVELKGNLIESFGAREIFLNLNFILRFLLQNLN